MALINPITNEYLAIEDVRHMEVVYRLHRNAEERQKFKDGTSSRYELSPQEVIHTAVDMYVNADPDKSVKDNQIVQ